MSAKHTPAPWTLSGGANGEWDIEAVGDQDKSGTGAWAIAQTFGSVGHGLGNEESDANALLIAAAPELLDALKALLRANDEVQNALCDGPDVPGWDRSALPRAQANVVAAEALAKSVVSKAETSK